MTIYVVLKFIHILSAIVAVGANITYGVWNARISSEPNHAAFTLKGIRFIDNRINLAEAGDTSSSGYVRLANRSRTIGPVLGILVVVILVMMVFKPTL